MAATSAKRLTFVAAVRASGAAAPFLASLVGRLPMGAVGLVLILRTEQITGSYAAGGLATGAYALSIGLLAPGLGRLIDLRGQTRVLLGAGVVYAAALMSFAALPGDAGVGLILPLAALIGASQPPLGSAVRAIWNTGLDDPVARHAVFTGEAAALEAIYIAGPVFIVAGIGGVLSIPAAALSCGVFGLLGTIWFVLTPASRAWRPDDERVTGLAGALASPGVRTLLGSMGLVGAGVGVIEVAVPALCERAGTPGATGFMLGLWGLGSLVGGVVAGRMSAAQDPAGRVVLLLFALALFTLPLVLASTAAVLGGLMFVSGIAIAPGLAAIHSLTGLLARRGTVTEAYTWLGTGMGAGIALGASLGGAVVEGAGTPVAFALAAGGMGAGAAYAALRRGTLRRA